jgi:hypothetical protein
MIKYLILLISLIVIGTTHLKLAQINYRDQYEQVIILYLTLVLRRLPKNVQNDGHQNQILR